MTHKFASLFFLVSVLCSAPFAVQAQQGIAATVNGEAISNFDVAQRAALLKLSGQNAGRSGAVDELIEERIKLQEAKKLTVMATDAEVDTAFKNIAARSKAEPDAFIKELAKRGVDADTLKARLRAQISWGRVVRTKARSVINVREQDVIDGLKKKGKDPATIKAYEYEMMQAIVFAAAGDAPSRAQSFRNSINGCDTARQHAVAVKDAAVRPPVRRNSNDLSEATRNELEHTAVGKTTSVQRTDKGYEFIILCGKKEVSGAEGAKTEMRNELMGKEVDQASVRLLTELKQRAQIDRR